MTTMDRVRQGLDEARGSWPQVARETGIDYFTICRIARGETQNPRFATVERLQKWLAVRRSTRSSKASDTGR